MKNKLWTIRDLLATSLAGAALFYIHALTRTRTIADPDRYLHLTISKIMAESGQWSLETLPQVHGLGWDKFFSDKEPLFHTLGALLHRGWGEAGVLLLPAVLSFFVLLTISLRIWLGSEKKSWLLALGMATAAYLCNPNLLHRFGLLRAHTLGVSLFLLLECALLLQSGWMAFSACFLFALSYHAFYLPFLLLIAHAASLKLCRKNDSLKPIFWASLGIGTGLILSPSFPGNLYMTWRVIQIALFEVGAASLNFGNELYPINTLNLLRAHGGFLAISGILAFGFGRSKKWETDELRPALAAGVLWLLMLKSPRASEYLLPVLIILAGSVVLSRSALAGSRWLRGGFLLLLISPLAAPGSLDFYHPKKEASGVVPPSLIKAVMSLPEESPRIFNIEWDISPQLIYANPKISVVDVLDPSLLFDFDRPLHDSRVSIAELRMPDLVGYLARAYPSDYLATKSPALKGIGELDPTLIRIYPSREDKPDPSGISLFRIRPESREHFMVEYPSARGADGLSFERTAQLGPKSAELVPLKAREGAGVAGGPTYLDAGIYFERHEADRPVSAERAEQVRCLLLTPSPAEMAKAAGRTLLGVGGGRYLRVWLNGARLYNTGEAPSSPKLIHQLIRLKRPLARSDRLEILACSQVAGSFLGVALSTWSPKDLEGICQAKDWRPDPSQRDLELWANLGALHGTCVGTLADQK